MALRGGRAGWRGAMWREFGGMDLSVPNQANQLNSPQVGRCTQGLARDPRLCLGPALSDDHEQGCGSRLGGQGDAIESSSVER